MNEEAGDAKGGADLVEHGEGDAGSALLEGGEGGGGQADLLSDLRLRQATAAPQDG